jgi:hypothetical protein
MSILTNDENEFLNVFLREATTSAFFSGPMAQADYAAGKLPPKLDQVRARYLPS